MIQHCSTGVCPDILISVLIMFVGVVIVVDGLVPPASWELLVLLSGSGVFIGLISFLLVSNELYPQH